MTPEAAAARATDYRARAAAARRKAEEMKSPLMRHDMLAVAQQWDELAEMAEKEADL